jgi:Co/Zn/Cd efflux system component
MAAPQVARLKRQPVYAVASRSDPPTTLPAAGNEFGPDAATGDRSTLRVAFGANIAMFGVGLVGGQTAHSTAILADAFDMLADASAMPLPTGQ